jgi:hypothetical protein
VRVLTSITSCHFNANLHEHWSMMFIVIKVKCFLVVHVEMAFMLTSTSQFNIWMPSNWLETMGQFTYSKRKMARLL